MTRIIWILLGWLTLLTVTQAASFDCGKVASSTEKLICGNKGLSSLDEKLNEAYKAALQNSDQADSIKDTQIKWLKDRDRCTNTDCLVTAYATRIYQLTSGSDSTIHKTLACPQCGVWAISNADEVAGSHNERVGALDGLVGSYLFIDEKAITIPLCGYFRYEIQEKSTSEQDGIVGIAGYEYKMLLKKETDSVLCKGNKWTLKLSIGSGSNDNYGQADFIMVPGPKGINSRRFHAWNIARAKPDEFDGTPGIGQVTSFKIAEINHAISATAVRLYKVYEHENAPPFDAARFSAKVEKYCGDYYKDVTYNPSIGNMMLACQFKILSAKLNEFLDWQCVDGKTSDEKKGCALPDESLK